MSEQLSVLRDGKNRASGKFSGFVDSTQFLEANDVWIHTTSKEHWISGSKENNNWIVFAIPNTLSGDGPHKVDFYESGLGWEALIDKVRNPVVAGWVTVAFKIKDAKRSGVEGNVNFVLKDGRNVTGFFDINSDQPL